MDENGEFVLNGDCLLEIMNYVIANCKAKPKRYKGDAVDYDDLIHFVLAHEFFVEMLKDHHKRLYEDLEMALVRRITKLLIDLPVNKQSNVGNSYFWRSYLESINERRPISVELTFVSDRVDINIKGKSFDCWRCETLHLNVISAEALADTFRLNRHLRKLTFEDVEIYESLSEIIPFCANLKELEINMKKGQDAAQFAPLAKIPNLRKIIIYGLFKSKAELKLFKDFRNWYRPIGLQPLTLTIQDFENEISRTPITVAMIDSLRYLCASKKNENDDEIIKAEYDFWEIPKKNYSIDESLETISVDAFIEIEFSREKGELRVKIRRESDKCEIGNLSKLPNLRRLVIRSAYEDYEDVYPLAKFLRFMVLNAHALKSCHIPHGSIGQLECIELAKIESLRYLSCHLSSWCSLKALSPLPNLQHVLIYFGWFISKNSNTSMMICNLLTACQVQATIIGSEFRITFRKCEKNLQIYMSHGRDPDIFTSLAQLDGVNTLQVMGRPNTSFLNTLFQDYAANLSTIQELDLSKLEPIRFEDISKVCEIKSIRKLKCFVSDTAGIQKLANLSKLEDLEIYITGNGSLSELFTKLAEKNIIQCIRCGKLSPEEIIRLSQIRSLKKLVCSLSDTEDLQSLTELANSSIEDLIVLHQNPYHLQSISVFSSDSMTKRRHLNIQLKQLSFDETINVTQITGLKKLSAGFFNTECVQILNRLPHLEDLTIGIIQTPEMNGIENPLRVLALKSPSTLKKLDLYNFIGIGECNCLTEIHTLESLKCSLRNEPGINVLANIKNLKELFIDYHWGSLSELFRAFALQSESKLQKLHTQINCSDEIREISQIKSLLTLHICYESKCDNLSDLCRLHELKSLSIVDKCDSEIDSDSVLPIFKSCQKLECVSLDFRRGVSLNFVNEVNDILKSKRDPTLQKPLKLTIFNRSVFPEFHVEDIDEANLNVIYLYEKFHYTEEDFFEDKVLDDSDSFDY